MKKRFETCTITLTPLSPIHISSGNADYGWGAVWLQQSQKMIVLDSEKFTQKLIENDLVKNYVSAVKVWTKLSDTQKQEQPNPCHTFIHNHMVLYSGTSLDNFVESLKKFEYDAPPPKSFIRNGEGKAYIPGSSIKGAIRTAVIYAILQEHIQRTKKDYLNDTYLKNIFNTQSLIPTSSQSGADLRKGLDEELLQSVLEDFDLTEKNELGQPISLQRNKPENGSITNLMRAILVSDSTPIPNVQKNLVNEEIKIIMLENADANGDRYLNRQALPYAVGNNKRQCYEPVNNSTITFKITIDHEILNSFHNQTNQHQFPIVFQNLKDLQKIIQTFYSKVWKAEQQFFFDDMRVDENSPTDKIIGTVLDFFEDDQSLLPNINIGLGSGMLCKTLFIMMNQEYRAKIRNLQMTGKQITNHNRGENGRGNLVNWEKKIAPNSRHLVFRQNGNHSNAYRPLGWANLNFGKPSTEEDAL
jgi:CRISPR-associated protein Csm5